MTIEPPTIRPMSKVSQISRSVQPALTAWSMWYAMQSSQRSTSEALRPSSSLVFGAGVAIGLVVEREEALGDERAAAGLVARTEDLVVEALAEVLELVVA